MKQNTFSILKSAKQNIDHTLFELHKLTEWYAMILREDETALQIKEVDIDDQAYQILKLMQSFERSKYLIERSGQ